MQRMFWKLRRLILAHFAPAVASLRQCTKFEAVEQFAGELKTCVVKLELQNKRRAAERQQRLKATSGDGLVAACLRLLEPSPDSDGVVPRGEDSFSGAHDVENGCVPPSCNLFFSSYPQPGWLLQAPRSLPAGN